MMKQPHKHAALIKAWADGAEVQHWSDYDNSWIDTRMPRWRLDFLYRIKPEPKPDVIKYVRAQKHSRDVYIMHASYANLKLTFDGETGKLKKAEVL